MSAKKLSHWCLFWLSLCALPVKSAVILQYHHVSETLPAVTSVSADTFRQHLQYLKDQDYQVVALNTLLDSLQAGKVLDDKTVAITFDDGYLNNFDTAAPILREFAYPYTIFVNPKLIDEGKSYVMTWAQLKALSQQGALIANHSAEHNYLHVHASEEDSQSWKARIKQDLSWSQQRIKDETGQDWPWIAYPYGEYNRDVQAIVKELGLIGIGQHSGAVNANTDWLAVPRYPASGQYANLDTLKTKLESAAFSFSAIEYDDTVTTNRQPSLKLTFAEINFHTSQLACYVSGQGHAKLSWVDERSVLIESPEPLKLGRSRYNCTAPIKTAPKRYFWYSHPWVVNDPS
ncbi:polysaccharide deacetylase family protein [Pseudoalteromonas fenneropenaei]|uniref:Polysaccharide deacetylase family protein n=1 Tax=Pseudoalteromonas fenneropenaei TaxID=1737459 RepID=A0ABV7CQ94_9GAMM